jgi:formylglycine-generating enzyme required for sulfatase activity
MARDDAMTGPKVRKTLACVLDLFLDLAADPDTFWANVKAALEPSPSRQASTRSSSKTIESKLQDLRASLLVRWIPARHPAQGRSAAAEERVWLEVTSNYHQADDPLHRSPSVKPTKEAIHACLNHLGCTQLDNDPRGIGSTHVGDALALLQKLQNPGPFVQLLKGKEDSKGEGHRWFALDFSGCEDRCKDACKSYILSAANHTFPLKGSPGSGLPPGMSPFDSPSDLDALARNCLEGVTTSFLRLQEVRERAVHVPLKVKMGLYGQAERDWKECVPEAADFRPVVAAPGSQLLLLWEEGGAGKTSLAFAIARWALDGKLADHPLLPILLDPEELVPGASVVERVHGFLRHLGGPDLDLDQVEELLRQKRVMLILDHFSELSDRERQWAHAQLPAQALVLLTTRLQEDGEDFHRRGWSVTQVQPQRLRSSEELFAFFEHYLQAKEQIEPGSTTDPLFTADNQRDTKDLLQRMVGTKEITVLLAWMVIEKALKHVRDGGVELLPSSVPQLMRNYVNDIDKTIPEDGRRLADGTTIEKGWVLACLKALALGSHQQGREWFPRDFRRSLALKILGEVRFGREEGISPAQREGVLRYLEERLHLLKRTTKPDRFSMRSQDDDGDPAYRLALDPLADYLAAMAHLDALRRDLSPDVYVQAMRDWLDLWLRRRDYGDVSGEDGGEPLARSRGFFAACRDCVNEWLSLYGPSLEAGVLSRWEEVPHDLARLAGIDRRKERLLKARFLIRRHAHDLEWANPELRPKAIAELTAYAKAAEGAAEMAVAVRPLALTMAEGSTPPADRAAAAEALGHIGGADAAKALIAMATNASEPVVAARRAAAEALGLCDASPKDHWKFLKELLEEEANHLRDETDPERIQAKLPLLQGASRGLQRLAARSRPFVLPLWGTEPGLDVPMLTLTTTAGAVTTRVVTIPVWQLPLPGGIPLEVVAIPGDTCTIGSPKGEEGRQYYGHRPEAKGVDVEAQREVTVPPFAMARYPLTQAQWRALAGERLEDPALILDPKVLDPATRKGADLPVETVNWHDAHRWCARLRRHLETEWGEAAPCVGLPSESLWEVACRAGADTPFHFGDTLDSNWANFRGTDIYGSGRNGSFLNRTTPVGAYGLVNAWGLADLHGNVWEWCADVWHPSPLVGPQDGIPWLEPLEGLLENRLLRGGSWFSEPHNCRSAYRNGNQPGNRIGNVGFRVCCLPPGLPSWSLVP